MSLVVAAGGSRALWYATRSTGVVALLLLTAVVCLGVAGSLRLRGDRWPRFLVVGLHRNLTLLTLAFLGAHIGTSVADSFAPIGLKDAVVPFLSSYRPFWLGLGAVAFDLLLALTVTSLLRSRVGYRTWRALHWLAYASWPVALVHSLGTGSDARLGWMQVLGTLATLTVIASVVLRVGASRTWTPPRLAALIATLLVPLGTLVWYRSGPGRPGWAARAGTPASLLAARTAEQRVAAPVRKPAVPVQAALPAPPFRARLDGRISESSLDADGHVLVSIRGRTRGSTSGVLWIRLQGEPTGGGGVVMTASGASFGPPSAPGAFVGSIVALEGTRMILALHGTSGGLDLHLDLRIDPASRHISGTVVGAAPAGASQ